VVRLWIRPIVGRQQCFAAALVWTTGTGAEQNAMSPAYACLSLPRLSSHKAPPSLPSSPQDRHCPSACAEGKVHLPPEGLQSFTRARFKWRTRFTIRPSSLQAWREGACRYLLRRERKKVIRWCGRDMRLRP